MAAMKSGLNNLVNWTHSSQMHTKALKYNVMNLGKRNANYTNRMEDCISESNDSEKDVSVAVSKQVIMNSSTILWQKS